MKKTLALILSICLVLSLCACGAGVTGASPTVVSVTMQDLSQSCYADDGSTLLFKYSDKLPSVTVSGNEAEQHDGNEDQSGYQDDDKRT